MIAFLVLAWIGCGVLAGCSDPPGAQENFERLRAKYDTDAQSRQNCLERGGIVILSAWDGRIIDCK